MMESEPAAIELAQIAIAVTDVDHVLPFYRDILGLPLLFRAGPNMAFLALGAVRVMLTTPQGAGSPGQNSILYFRVPDLDAAYAEMVDKGALSQRGPQLAAKLPDHELWMAFLRDPDNNLIGLLEERS